MTKELIVGIDEAGRGPLAGPVIAAAVILGIDHSITGLDDSKRLSAKKREFLYDIIKARSLDWGIGRAEPAEIDEINILQASLLAMQRAVSALRFTPTLALVDGIHAPNLDCRVETIIKGDQTVAEISAASILAKVERDREMVALDQQYPGYGFAAHKGYPTKAHVAAIKTLGVTSIHRRTFAPARPNRAE